MNRYIFYPVKVLNSTRVKFYTVSNGRYAIASFWCDRDDEQTEMEAYALAKDYCDRLNAEYRKEQQ